MNSFYPKMILFSLCLLLTACLPFGGPNRSPETVVKAMYESLSESDMDGYMDTLHPSNRRVPNPVGLLSSLSMGIGAQVGFFGINFDLSGLFKFSFRNLNLQIIRQQGDYALVEARGSYRIPMLMMEMIFCEQHDVVRDGGKWYIDMMHPNREQRFERIIAMQQAQLEQQQQNLPHFNTPEEELAYLFQEFPNIMESSLNLCPP